MNVHRFNIRHLAALAEIVRTGSVSAGARAVNLTQPAVTQGIAKLERQLSVALFDRSHGGIVVREEARLLAARVETMLRLIGTRNATTTQLRAFVAVARAGSYAGASAATGLADASLHRAVSDLSLVLGVRLVERRGRSLALTRRGAILARDVRLALSELRAGLAEVEAVQGRECGRISIGAMPLARARVLPDTVAAFYKSTPQVDVSIIEGSYMELVGPLRDGEIDLMVGALRDLAPGGDLIETPLFKDRPLIVGRVGHPLAKLDSASVAQLAEFPWIVAAEGTPLRALWRRLFEDEGVTPPHVPIACGAVITIRRLLVQGDFLTLLSPDQLTVELQGRMLARIADAPPSAVRTIGVTTRLDWRPTLAQSRFLTLLTEHGSQSS